MCRDERGYIQLALAARLNSHLGFAAVFCASQKVCFIVIAEDGSELKTVCFVARVSWYCDGKQKQTSVFHVVVIHVLSIFNFA